MARQDLVFALREFIYDDNTGTVDRGQVIELRGHRNDEKLVTLRYLSPVHRGTSVSVCGVCGRKFIDESSRDAHGTLRHAFECECGWVPPVGDSDRAGSLATHRARCESAVKVKQRAREVQRQEISTQPGRTD